MDWTEIKIEVSAKDLDKAGDIANMAVPYGIYIEDYSSLEQEVLEIARIDMIDEELIKKDRNTGIIHIYISPEENPNEAVDFLKERYSAEGIEYKVSTDNCVEEDWMNNWKKYFSPIEVGERLLIRPTWHDGYDPKDRTVLNLDPGIAFGSGTHETTRLCLKTLEKYINKGDKVLDIGCGSGILAIASLLLGAEKAVGVDIDSLAVKTAEENAKINNVQDKFEAVCGNLTDKISGEYNIILANIVADAIIALSKDVHSFMNEKTVYIMSGIINIRLDEVMASLQERYNIISVESEKDWYCIAAMKK